MVTSVNSSLEATQPYSQSDVIDDSPQRSKLGMSLKEQRYAVVENVVFKENYPGLCFCECLGVNVREDMVRAALWRVPQLYKKDEEIELVGFASGGSLQELIILSDLLHLGYCNLRVSLIDISYSTDQSVPDQFRQFAREELSRQVVVSGYEDLESYLKTRDSKVPAIVTMFDLERYTGVYDVNECKKRGRLVDYGVLRAVESDVFPESTLLVYNATEREANYIKAVTVKERRDYSLPILVDLKHLE